MVPCVACCTLSVGNTGVLEGGASLGGFWVEGFGLVSAGEAVAVGSVCMAAGVAVSGSDLMLTAAAE